jgi:hypothetical protein
LAPRWSDKAAEAIEAAGPKLIDLAYVAGNRGLVTTRASDVIVGGPKSFVYLLPLLEYSGSGSRIERRGAGEEERPPAGIAALPQMVLPDLYGSYGTMKTGSFRLAPGNQQESSAATYCGLLASLFLAPLAFVSPAPPRPVLAFAHLS